MAISSVYQRNVFRGSFALFLQSEFDYIPLTNCCNNHKVTFNERNNELVSMKLHVYIPQLIRTK